MERHDTHNISCSSSEDHSYKLENYQTTKNVSSENKFYTKEEEKNEWSKIISNKNIGDNESYNINDIIQNNENKKTKQEDIKKKNNNKNETKLEPKSNSPDNKTKGNNLHNLFWNYSKNKINSNMKLSYFNNSENNDEDSIDIKNIDDSSILHE